MGEASLEGAAAELPGAGLGAAAYGEISSIMTGLLANPDYVAKLPRSLVRRILPGGNYTVGNAPSIDQADIIVGDFVYIVDFARGPLGDGSGDSEMKLKIHKYGAGWKGEELGESRVSLSSRFRLDSQGKPSEFVGGTASAKGETTPAAEGVDAIPEVKQRMADLYPQTA